MLHLLESISGQTVISELWACGDFLFRFMNAVGQRGNFHMAHMNFE